MGKNYERPTSKVFVDQIRTEEEMNDIEESLSDQENKKLLVGILQPLTYPVISCVEMCTIKIQRNLSREHCLSYTLLKEVVEFLKRLKMEFFMKNAIYYSFLFHFRSPILPYSHPP